MSGVISQLVAVGAQDVHLVNQPEISFFRSVYKRHINFSQTVERQLIQGSVFNNGVSTVRFEHKGDMLNYVYLVPFGSDHMYARSFLDKWLRLITKVELLVGGQVIDEQDPTYSTLIAPTLSASTFSKSVNAGLYNHTTKSRFYPLRFFFCENWQSSIPLIALRYHDVELRITWGSQAAETKWEVYANYIHLDSQEREFFTSNPQNMLITQVQKVLASNSKIQELNFNHPVKYLAAAGETGVLILGKMRGVDNKLKLRINGIDVSDYKFANPNFSRVSLYYHTAYSSYLLFEKLFLYPFCLETSKLQPTGTLNFSRIDSAQIVNDVSISTEDIYAVSYNILRIEKGMGGLLYSN
jgi:hypothetical protein